jgi:hypothetical protein
MKRKHACACFPSVGGDEEDRTLYLTDANRTLSQVSYIPALFKLHSPFYNKSPSDSIAGTKYHLQRFGNNSASVCGRNIAAVYWSI